MDRIFGKKENRTITAVMLFVVFMFLICLCLCNVTIDFDGAMNDQVAQNLSAGKGYSTSYIDEGYNGTRSTLFDHKIQTGVTVILPTALLDCIFGPSSKHMQIVLMVYYFLLLTEIYFSVSRKSNRLIGFLAILFLIPFTMDNVFHGYGEVAMFFFMYSVIILFDKAHKHEQKKYWVLTGVIAGLGYLTKTVFLIILPAFFIAMLADLKTTGMKKTAKHYGLILLSAAGVVLVFETYKLISLKGIENYFSWWQQEISCILTEASTRDHSGRGIADLFADAMNNASWFGNTFHISKWFVFLFIILSIILVIQQLRKKEKDYENLVLCTVYLTYLFWWLFIVSAGRLSERRILSAFIISVLITLSLPNAVSYPLQTRLQASKGKYIRVGLLLIIGAVGISMLIPRIHAEAINIRQSKDSKTSIEEAVAFIHLNDREKQGKYYGAGWWQNPVIADEAGIVMHNMDCEEIEDEGLFVEDVYMRALSGTSEEMQLKFFCEKIFDNQACTIWKIYKNRDEKIAEQGNYLYVNAFMPYWGYINVTYNNSTQQRIKYTCMYDHVTIPAPNDEPIRSVTIEFENFEDNKSEVKQIKLITDREIDLLEPDAEIETRIVN